MSSLPRLKIYCFEIDTVKMARRFPNAIPSGTRVPQWALLDVTVRCYVFFLDGNVFTAFQTSNNWNSNQSITVGGENFLFFRFFLIINVSHPRPVFIDTPEILPGKLIGTSGATTAATATATGGAAGSHTTSSRVAGSSTDVPTPTPKSGSSNVGAIVGGVVGGVAAISIAVAAIFFFMRRERTQAPIAATPAVGVSQPPPMEEIQQPLADDSTYAGSTMPGTPVIPMKLYVCLFFRVHSAFSFLCMLMSATFFDTQDPSDPTTYPGYQGVPQSPDTPQGFAPSLNGNTNSLATMQTSRTQGYHGLPTV